VKILVTGSNGFIGSAYCKKMRSQGHQIVHYDLPHKDILWTHQMDQDFKDEKPDLVVHFAAMADVNVCYKYQRQTMDVNIIGTYNVAEACVNHGIPLIHTSTCCVYGNSLDKEENEFTTNPQAREPYACSKVACEYILRGMPGLHFVALRIGTVYGVGMRDALFCYIALNNTARGFPVYINGTGEQVRQFVYLDDLIDGYKRVSDCFAVNGIKSGSIFNLCGREAVSVNHVVRVAESITGKKAQTINREERYGETYRENISIDYAQNILGWRPKTPFLDGMNYTFNHDERFDNIRLPDL